MPVAFNPPRFPTADAAIATVASTAGATVIPPDAFALLLLAAGGDVDAIAGKDASATMTRGRPPDTHGGRMVADDKSPPTRPAPRDSLFPIEPAKRDGPAKVAPGANRESAFDPAAMTAALSAVIGLGIQTNSLAPRDAAAGVVEMAGERSQPVPQSGDSFALCEPAAVLAGATERPHPSPQRGVGRVDPDAPPAASAASTPSIALRASETLGAFPVSKELIEQPTAKLKETSDDAGSSVTAHSVAPGQVAVAAAPATVHAIAAPVTASGWADEFAGKLTQVVMLRNDRAEFHLHPAELGPVDVQISFASDQAVVLITAAHATTRDALEQALPYLRDMLAEQGIALGHASVQGEHNPADPGGAGHGGAAPSAGVPPDTAAAAVRTIELKGLVDVFA